MYVIIKVSIILIMDTFIKLIVLELIMNNQIQIEVKEWITYFLEHYVQWYLLCFLK